MAGRKPVPMVGRDFHGWWVVEFAGERKGSYYWRCRCECGREKVVEGGSLRSGRSKSCRCRPNKGHRTHGMRRSSEYASWLSMRNRCRQEGQPYQERYGAKGVTVCERWATSFENFLADMGPKPTPKHTVERKDNTKGYEPGNCGWATPKEQARNRKTTRMFTHDGVTLCIKDWCVRLGLNEKTVRTRINAAGKTIGQALGLEVG